MNWVVFGLGLAVLALVMATLLIDRRRRRAEAELRRFRRVFKDQSERPSVLSHEVRTPLALIQGSAELLAEESPGPLTEQQRVFVKTILENSSAVVQLAEDLLAVSTMEAQLFEMRWSEVDLRAQVRQTVRDLRRVHEVWIQLDDQGPPLLVLGDQTLLRQALTNLINNAVRHAGAEAPITVRVNQDGRNAIVSVSDSGAGMTPGARECLFQPFQVGDSPKPGTGLGMMIVDRIVEMHDGRVLVDTEVGHGTDIFLILPLKATKGGDHGPAGRTRR